MIRTIFRLAFTGIALLAVVAGSTPSQAGQVLTVEIGPVIANSGAGAAYYFDVNLTNSTSTNLTLGGFSIGITTNNANVQFAQATTDTTTPYLFTGYSLFAPDITSSIASSPAAQIIAGDVFFDPSQNLAGADFMQTNTAGLARIYFDFSGTIDPSLAFSLVTDANITNLSGPAGDSITGSVTSIGNSLYNIDLIETATVPEPTTVLLALQALASFTAFYRGIKVRTSHRSDI